MPNTYRLRFERKDGSARYLPVAWRNGFPLVIEEAEMEDPDIAGLLDEHGPPPETIVHFRVIRFVLRRRKVSPRLLAPPPLDRLYYYTEA